MNKITTFLVVAIIMIGCQSMESENPPEIAEISFEESFAVFPNQERGFMHTVGAKSEGTPLNQSFLNNQSADGVTLLLRIYYLEKFKTSSLSTAQLELISNDFDKIRSAGMKCVLRFAYTDGSDDGNDAALSVVLDHLDQLQPIVAKNADIIAFVQAGFVGWWGEWHSSTHDLASESNSKALVNKLLNVFPDPIKIQLRTPRLKKAIFDENSAMDDEIGYSDQEIARVGHHNDCFMASTTDYGTYDNPTTDKNYISQEAFYVPTGGETCPPSGIPAANCQTADQTMSLLKWTYLNLDWYGPLLNDWRDEGCFEDFEKKMGYRLVLRSAHLPSKQSNNDSLRIKLTLENVGWAPIYYPKIVTLELVNTDTDAITKIILDADLRRVRSDGSLELSQSFDITGLSKGIYNYHLKIADQAPTLADLPAYCLQLANVDTWNADRGTNDLNATVVIE